DRLSRGLDCLSSRRFDVIVLDLSLPDSTGLETFRRLHALASSTPIVVLTGLSDATVGIAAVQQGAQDYLVKGQVDGPLLVRALRYAIERKRLEEQQRLLVEASRILASSIDYETSVRYISELGVSTFAEACILVLRGDGQASPR